MNNINHLPKIELHLHLDCSLSFDVVQKIDPSITKEMYDAEFIAPSKCINLPDFLTRAVKGISLMQTRENIELVIHDLFHQMQRDNILYAELRFAPLQHLEKGLTAKEVVATAEMAVAGASHKTGIDARLILCTLRHYTKEQSMETVQLVEQFKNTYVAGFDIAADEAGFPIDNHVEAFRYAHKKKIPCTAHAGEAAGAESVWETLQYLGPSRIGHGVRSIEDESLIKHLRKNKIHLEVCPTCNVQINIYDTYEQHPVDKLYRAGVPLNINTDTRTITNITLNKEYKNLQEIFGWTLKDFYACNVNAVHAAFIPQDLKDKLIAKLQRAYGLTA